MRQVSSHIKTIRNPALQTLTEFLLKFSTLTPNVFLKLDNFPSYWLYWVHFPPFLFESENTKLPKQTNKQTQEKWRERKIQGISRVMEKERLNHTFLSKRLQRGLRIWMLHTYQIKAGSTCKKSPKSCEQAYNKVFLKEKWKIRESMRRLMPTSFPKISLLEIREYFYFLNKVSVIGKE